jgi:hypothetical protein
MGSLLRHDRGNGVLEDELFLVVGFQYQRILVKAFDAARELDATHQIDGDDNFVFARIVQEAVLNILRRFWIHHIPQKNTPCGQVKQYYFER